MVLVCTYFMIFDFNRLTTATKSSQR